MPVKFQITLDGGQTGKPTVFGAVKSRTKTILPGHAGIQVSYKKWNTRVQVQVLSFSARAAEVVKKKHAL